MDPGHVPNQDKQTRMSLAREGVHNYTSLSPQSPFTVSHWEKGQTDPRIRSGLFPWRNCPAFVSPLKQSTFATEGLEKPSRPLCSQGTWSLLKTIKDWPHRIENQVFVGTVCSMEAHAESQERPQMFTEQRQKSDFSCRGGLLPSVALCSVLVNVCSVTQWQVELELLSQHLILTTELILISELKQKPLGSSHAVVVQFQSQKVLLLKKRKNFLKCIKIQIC